MRVLNYLFVFTLSLFMLSCSGSRLEIEETSGKSGINYSNSKDLWKKLKSENEDSYSYTVNSISWTGNGSRTHISIKDGTVIRREYTYYKQDRNEDGEPIEIAIESYIETGEEIGNNAEGFDPLLIDELYETCFSEYLNVNREENTIYFDTDENGIISNCGFVEKGCVDDCFIGFRISEFKWL
ncbi:hypothetical protein [uncultured Salegentibacter sp.]|uniref:hypothetical protein n=1 Tax=uncultured Salegentibacter sp. TaxID=259320 RepID=UPI002596ABA9|nr:hypothetical protein [uncultured Salegentibacter sp.]